MRTPRRSMTLVEVVVALALLVVILTGIGSSLGSSRLATLSTKEHQAASAEAYRRLDLVLATPFDQAVALWDDAAFAVRVPDSNLNLLPASTPINSGVNTAFPGRIDLVLDPDGNGSTGLLEVRVRVAWIGGNGFDRRLEIVSRATR